MAGGSPDSHDPNAGDATEVERRLVALINSGKLRIPPYPAVALKVRQLLARPDYQVRDLYQCISSDQAISAMVLARANSAAYHSVDPITSIDRAVVRVGAEELRRVTLVLATGEQAAAEGPMVIYRRLAWQASVVSGVVCQALAPRRGLDAQEAFACGLLHDFGETVTVQAIEDLWKQSRQWEARPTAYWNALIQRFHVEVGVMVARCWLLRGTLEESLKYHHTTEPSRLTPLVQLLQLCDAVTASLHSAPPADAVGAGWLPMLTDPEDRRIILELLPRLPKEVAAFDPPATRLEAAPKAARPSPVSPESKPLELVPDPATMEAPVVEAGPSSIGSRGSAANFVVWHLPKGDPEMYMAVRLAPDGLAFQGSKPMKTGWLTKLRLECQPSFEAWFTIIRCDQRAGKHLIVARPFGLGADEGKVWHSLHWT